MRQISHATLCLVLLAGCGDAGAPDPSRDVGASLPGDDADLGPNGLAISPTRLVVELRPDSDALDRLRNGAVDEDLVRRAGAQSAAPLFGATRDAAARQRAGLDRFVVVELPVGSDIRAAKAALEARADVASVEFDVIGAGGGLTPDDTHYPTQWHLENSGQSGGTVDADIDASEAWSTTTGDASIVVAVLDTGIDSAHPEFAGRIVAGYDFVNRDDDPEADHSHGTSCAGIIAANANNGFGVAGVDWAAKIMPVKVLDANNSGLTTNLASGLTFAADNGADVISMSLINYPCGSAALESALQYARDQGAVLISSAGNGGIGNADVSGPGCYPQTISVGATTRNDQRAGFSATGAALDVVAPGSSVPTVAYRNYGDTYVNFSGTSAAAPVVAGISSLLLAADRSLTHVEIQTLLETSARDGVGAELDDTVGRDDNYGWGRVNVADVLAALDPAPLRAGLALPETLVPGEASEFGIVFTDVAGLAPDFVEVVVSGPESFTLPLVASTSGTAHPSFVDGDFANGERFDAARTFTLPGDYTFHFEAMVSGRALRFPATGEIEGLAVIDVLEDVVASSERSNSSDNQGASFSDTFVDDGREYTLYEVVIPGRAAGEETSALDHEFRFVLPPAREAEFHLDARKIDLARERDEFDVQVSTDGGFTWTYMFSVRNDASLPSPAVYSLPEVDDEVIVRFVDTDRSPGNIGIDALAIDHMFLRVFGTDGGCDVAPTADFKAPTLSGVAPLVVDFDDFSAGEIDSWSWDFGDGETSTEANPSHTYTTPGLYTVTLEVANDCGRNAMVREDYIEVLRDDAPATVHVAAQSVRREYLGRGRYQAIDDLRIEDADGEPVADASVTAFYFGPTVGSAQGTTDANGETSLVSEGTRRYLRDDWCFYVLSVEGEGLVYDENANVVTIACE